MHSFSLSCDSRQQRAAGTAEGAVSSTNYRKPASKSGPAIGMMRMLPLPFMLCRLRRFFFGSAAKSLSNVFWKATHQTSRSSTMSVSFN